MLRSSQRSQDEKVVLTWKNVNFQTIVKDPSKSKFCATVYKTKHVLNNLSGRAVSGELTAILGPTGCGKTSLMNVLAARFPSGGSANFSLSGSIDVNGKPRNDDFFRKISAYVMQDDNMYAFLTVFETLMLSAHFFLPVELSDEEKTNVVDAVIAELGLVKARDTIIGNDKVRGVSGGERKRASIAVQLLTDPAVLFLDEPTSGLDAFQSQAVMDSLKKLASNGRLVMSVIHQPRSSIYEMFDNLIILSEGRLMYDGTQLNAVEYFAHAGYPCPESFNPSDFFLDILSPDHRSKESEEVTKNRIAILGNKFQEHSKAVSEKVVAEGLQVDDFKTVKMVGTEFSWEKTIRNMGLLFWRSFIQQSRDVPTTMSKIMPSIFFALLIGGLYSNIGNSQQSIMNRKGVLFFILINQGFISVTSVLGAFPIEKIIVGRERAGRAYNTLSYCVAKILVELPLNILPVAIYCCILSPLIGLNPHHFGYFILICCMNACVIIALGLVISAIAPSQDAANALSAPFLIIGILFGGFYIKISSLPVVLNLVPYVSAFKWAFEALCINEFQDQSFSCDLIPDTQCLTTGAQVLETLNFQHHTTNYAVFGLGMLWLAYLVWVYLMLEFNTIKYISLGFTGGKFKTHGDVQATPRTSYEKLNPQKVTDNNTAAGYEMVQTNEKFAYDG